jgi:crotonobetainyl-CoA:carnitine CoA-transferase CaiB-like acyl-CoA transferase
MNATETFLGPLSVIELGSRIAVGAAGSLLSQLGATVTVVEPPRPSSAGKWKNRAPMMAGKKSVMFDRAAQAPELAGLLRAADVILLSSDTDPEDLSLWREAPANAIVCDITAAGHDGPLAGVALSEGLVEAITGIADITGTAEGAPTIIGTPILDMHAAVYASGAIVSALRLRRLRGLAERIDVALFDVGATALINYLPLFLVGRPSTRSGNRHPLFTPWSTFDAVDGTVQICAVTDLQWKAICEAMQTPKFVADPRFATSAARFENRAPIEAVVNEWTRKNSVAECERLLNLRGIASGGIVKITEVADDINVRHRESVLELRDPLDNSPVAVLASPFRSIPVGGRSADRIPLPGEDTARVEALLDRSGSAVASVVRKSADGVRPFDGVRVVEIGQYTVAPLASRIMGALGADVIKVESPTGDALRSVAPFRADTAAYIFAVSNSDKRGIVLDLRQQGDRDTLHEILSTADILVENLKPGSLAKQGFGAAELRKRHRHLIYCSISGFGTDSAYPSRPALDTVIQAASGLMDITRPEGEPTKAGISSSDNLGGQFGFLALAAALELRDRTGIAVHFDLSMQDLSLWASQLEWNGKRSVRPAIVRVADGYVAVDDPAIAAKAQALSHLPRQEMAAALASGDRVAQVLTVSEVFRHPQTIARGLLADCPTPEGDLWTVFSLPFRMTYTRTNVRRVMGPLGGTDGEVRADIAREVGCKNARSAGGAAIVNVRTF